MSNRGRIGLSALCTYNYSGIKNPYNNRLVRLPDTRGQGAQKRPSRGLKGPRRDGRELGDTWGHRGAIVACGVC